MNSENSNKQIIRIKLHGFKNLILNNNSPCECENEIIENFYIDDKLEYIQLVLKNDIDIEKDRDKIDCFLYHIYYNLLMHRETKFDVPYFDCEYIKNAKHIKVTDKIEFFDTVNITTSISAEGFYNEILLNSTEINSNFLKYKRIFKTLENPNIIIQYMSLYQYLMELLSGNNKNISQKAVIKYFKSNKEKYPFVSFEETRKSNSNYEEDCFTYLRNEIAHCEKTNNFSLYCDLGSKISQLTIKNLIKVINDVIQCG